MDTDPVGPGPPTPGTPLRSLNGSIEHEDGIEFIGSNKNGGESGVAR
jgi:hypothetical protein